MWTVLLRARCVSGVLRVLRARARCVARFSWEDVDVSDASFMMQSRAQVLRMLLRSETVSLYALNAPVRGVTPLGLARSEEHTSNSSHSGESRMPSSA